MANYYYMYSIFWLIVLGLYEIPICDFNSTLSPALLLFLLFTILTSFILGILHRDHFHKNCEIYSMEFNTRIVTTALFLFWIVDFVGGGQIPLISIAVFHNSGYTDFEGVPVLHVLTVILTCLFLLVLFDKICKTNNKVKKKEYTREFLVLLFLMFLLFYRGILIMIAYGCFTLYLLNRNEKKLTLKKLLLIIVIAIIILYLFGVFGNIRMGNHWNDSSSIESMGKYYRFPKLIPKQFMWAYSYITSPLANLNNRVIRGNYNHHFNMLYASFVPDILTKKILNQTNSVSLDNSYLIEQYFNAATGYDTAFAYGGIMGMYIYYAILVAYSEVCYKIASQYRFNNACLSVFSIIFVFVFFNNTLSYSTLSLQPIVLLLIQLVDRRVKFSIRGKYILYE